MKNYLSVSTKLFMASACTRFLLILTILIVLWVAIFWSVILV